MSDEPAGRRERKKWANHQLLRSAALSLGAERSLADLTVEDIAAAADVSVRSFYDHFSSKEDAMIGFDTLRIAQLRDNLLARPPQESPLEALHATLRLILEESNFEWPLRTRVLATNPTLLPRMFSSFIVYERSLVEAVAARTGLDSERDLYPTLVTAVATGAFRASITMWRASAERGDLATIFDAAFERVADGLPEPPPAKE